MEKAVSDGPLCDARRKKFPQYLSCLLVYERRRSVLRYQIRLANVATRETICVSVDAHILLRLCWLLLDTPNAFWCVRLASILAADIFCSECHNPRFRRVQTNREEGGVLERSSFVSHELLPAWLTPHTAASHENLDLFLIDEPCSSGLRHCHD